MVMLDNIGEQCRKARVEANISLRKAAFEMGYSPATVSRFERGEIFRINPDMLVWYKYNTDLFDKEYDTDLYMREEK